MANLERKAVAPRLGGWQVSGAHFSQRPQPSARVAPPKSSACCVHDSPAHHPSVIPEQFMNSLIRVIVVAFRNPPRWRSMLLPAQGCRRAAQVHLRGDSRRPSFELRVDRHPGRIFLPFWPGRGARSTSSGVGGKELQERRNAGAGGPNRPSSFWLRAGSSYVALQTTGKARVRACAIEPVSLGCDQEDPCGRVGRAWRRSLSPSAPTAAGGGSGGRRGPRVRG